MTFNASIPQATDLISNSQAQLLANFGQLNTQFGVDHVAFNTGSGNGDGTHKKITFDNAPAEPACAGTVSAIFPLLTAGRQELFFKNASQKTQITGPTTAATPGSTVLPGGIIIKWGSGTVNGGPTAVNFVSAFPNNCWGVIAQPVNSNIPTVANDYVYTSSPGLSSFNATGTRRITLAATPVTFFYIAIGN